MQRAEEVDKLDKKIAYYCRLYAVSQVRFAILAGAVYDGLRAKRCWQASNCILPISKL